MPLSPQMVAAVCARRHRRAVGCVWTEAPPSTSGRPGTGKPAERRSPRPPPPHEKQPRGHRVSRRPRSSATASTPQSCAAAGRAPWETRRPPPTGATAQRGPASRVSWFPIPPRPPLPDSDAGGEVCGPRKAGTWAGRRRWAIIWSRARLCFCYRRHQTSLSGGWSKWTHFVLINVPPPFPKS